MVGSNGCLKEPSPATDLDGIIRGTVQIMPEQPGGLNTPLGQTRIWGILTVMYMSIVHHSWLYFREQRSESN